MKKSTLLEDAKVRSVDRDVQKRSFQSAKRKLTLHAQLVSFGVMLIALIIGTDGLEGAITMLSPAYKDKLDAAGAVVGKELDLAASIYIDWGSFISAIINFLLIAFVLFSIVKTLNNLTAAREKAIAEMGTDYNEKKAIRKIKKSQKISYQEAKAVYEAEVKAAKEKALEEAAAASAKAAEEARIAEEKATANTRLLEEIRDLLKNK